MKKMIAMRATATRAREAGYEPRSTLVMLPVEVDLEALTPAARWMVEHINATFVVDEILNDCNIYAESTQTMQARDRARGMDDDMVKKYAEVYGGIYTDDLMRVRVTFPILSRQTPEAVLEEAVKQLVSAGAGRIICGEEVFELCQTFGEYKYE